MAGNRVAKPEQPDDGTVTVTVQWGPGVCNVGANKRITSAQVKGILFHGFEAVVAGEVRAAIAAEEQARDDALSIPVRREHEATDAAGGIIDLRSVKVQ